MTAPATSRTSRKRWGLFPDLNGVLGFTPQLVDLDADGWLDLLLASDVCSSRVYRNNAGQVASSTSPT